MKYHRNNPLYFQSRPVSRYDLTGPDVSYITEGDVDPVEKILRAPGKRKAPHAAFTALPEDSYNGHHASRPRKGRVSTTNMAEGGDFDATTDWRAHVTQEAGIDDAEIPLDRLLTRHR